MAWDFELVAGPYGGMTDGPVWDGQGVLFSNMADNAILRYDPAGGSVSVFRPYWIRVKGLALDAEGTLYGCQSGSRRIVRFNKDGSASPLRARLEGELHNCPDDLAIDRRGRIWFSDPYDPLPPRGPDIRPFLDHASVLRLQPPRATSRPAGRGTSGDAWQLRRITFDTYCPRGVLLSRDEDTLYVTESDEEPGGQRELRAYELSDDGSVLSYLVLYSFGADDRNVDGMCLDGQGNIIVCAGSAKGPGAIHVFSPSGGVLERHAMPEDQPTNCAFGDTNRGSLYVTTAEGRLYRVRDTGRQG